MLHTLKTENGDGIVESEDGEIRRYRGDMPTGAAIVAAVAEIERLRYVDARVSNLEAELAEERKLCVRRTEELDTLRQIYGIPGTFGNPSPVIQAATDREARRRIAEGQVAVLRDAIAELAHKAGL